MTKKLFNVDVTIKLICPVYCESEAQFHSVILKNWNRAIDEFIDDFKIEEHEEPIRWDYDYLVLTQDAGIEYTVEDCLRMQRNEQG